MEWTFRFTRPDGKLVCECEGPTPESEGVDVPLFAVGMAHIVRTALTFIAKSGADRETLRHIRDILSQGVEKRPSILRVIE